MTRKLLKEYEEWGLSVNRSKTKNICIGDDRDDLHPQENDKQLYGIYIPGDKN